MSFTSSAPINGRQVRTTASSPCPAQVLPLWATLRSYAFIALTYVGAVPLGTSCRKIASALCGPSPAGWPLGSCALSVFQLTSLIRPDAGGGGGGGGGGGDAAPVS